MTRVKRAGWRGWWVHARDGALVPDGHVEPIDRTAPPAPAPKVVDSRFTPCRGGHGTAFRGYDSHGYQMCHECRREERRRAKLKRSAR